MKFKAIIFNLYGSKIISQMMEDDDLIHAREIELTTEKLLELTNRYDVTARTIGNITRIFLAKQAVFFPGDYEKEGTKK